MWVVCTSKSYVIWFLVEFTRQYWFLCVWDTRDTDKYCLSTGFPKQTGIVCGCGKPDVVYLSALFNHEDVPLSSLHLEFGLTTNFLKTINKNVPGFLYLKKKYFFWSRNTPIMKNNTFDQRLYDKKLCGGTSLRAIIKGLQSI